jgi:hypothetical protein
MNPESLANFRELRKREVRILGILRTSPYTISANYCAVTEF